MERLSDFALFCRKIRLDNNQILKEMAESLGVSSSYLSAVENEKRKNIVENKVFFGKNTKSRKHK